MPNNQKVNASVRYELLSPGGSFLGTDIYAQDASPGGSLKAEYAQRAAGLILPIYWELSNPITFLGGTVGYTKGGGYGEAIYLYNGTGGALDVNTPYEYVEKALNAVWVAGTAASPGDVKKSYTVQAMQANAAKGGYWGQKLIVQPFTALADGKWGWFLKKGLSIGTAIADGTHSDGTGGFGVVHTNAGGASGLVTSGAPPSTNLTNLVGVAVNKQDGGNTYDRLPVLFLGQWVFPNQATT
jgi:hypothetical protein